MQGNFLGSDSCHRYAIAKTAAIIAIIAVLAIYNAWANETARADESMRSQMIEDARGGAKGPYATDGTFIGSAEGYGGQVTMSVTVQDGWITDVSIEDASQEDAAWLEMAQVLPQRIIESQNPNIDVVSGATFTSTGILNGVTEALIQSMSGNSAISDDSAEITDAKEGA